MWSAVQRNGLIAATGAAGVGIFTGVDGSLFNAGTIAGGSDEVQRNIIAERMLDMPREPKGWTLAGASA